MSDSTENNEKPVKNLGGRPLKFQDPEKLQQRIDAYFEHCDNTIIKKQHVTGKGEIIVVPTPTPYTMAGLAAWLEISRKNLLEYNDRNGFRNIITRARDKIEASNITLALTGCHDSRIAALNLSSNYGYATKQDSGPPAGITINVLQYQPQPEQIQGTITPQLPAPGNGQSADTWDAEAQDIE